MDASLQGMSLSFWVMVILYFISRKKGGKWTTAFRIVAWVFGLSSWYYLIVKSGGYMSFYTVSLVAIAVLCFLCRNKDQVWKIGFWISLIFLVGPVIGLVLAIRG
jgi:hypothetical protein